jgi:hypothetical protein
MFSFFLASESNDSILRLVSVEVTRVYEKIVMHVARLPPLKTKQAVDPKAMWGNLRSIVTRLIDMISSDRGESLRMQSLRLAENLILFGLPVEKLSLDPRLAKSRQPVGDAGKQGLSAEDIPLHHTFINRNELEQEAESLFSKMLLWSSKKGPQGHPFTPSQMSQLGVCIANVASVKPKKSANAATALAVLLQSKDSVCPQMTGAERDLLARSTQKLLRAAYASSDAEVMNKLRVALESLVALGIGATPTDVAPEATAGKRIGGVSEEDAGEDDLPVEEGADQSLATLRASAIAAVDAAENNLISKAPKIDSSSLLTGPGAAAAGAIVGGGGQGLPPGVTSGLGTTVAGTGSSIAASADTELASDLLAFPDSAALSNIKMVTLQTKPASTAIASTAAAAGLTLRPAAIATELCSELALKSLQRVLDSIQDTKNFNAKVSSPRENATTYITSFFYLRIEDCGNTDKSTYLLLFIFTLLYSTLFIRANLRA